GVFVVAGFEVLEGDVDVEPFRAQEDVPADVDGIDRFAHGGLTPLRGRKSRSARPETRSRLASLCDHVELTAPPEYPGSRRTNPISGEVVEVAAHPPDVAVRRPAQGRPGVGVDRLAEVVVQPVELERLDGLRDAFHHGRGERDAVR